MGNLVLFMKFLVASTISIRGEPWSVTDDGFVRPCYEMRYRGIGFVFQQRDSSPDKMMFRDNISIPVDVGTNLRRK